MLVTSRCLYHCRSTVGPPLMTVPSVVGRSVLVVCHSVQVVSVPFCSRSFRIQRVRFLVFATLHCNYMESPKIKLVPNLI